jgi:hypothetical protein
MWVDVRVENCKPFLFKKRRNTLGDHTRSMCSTLVVSYCNYVDVLKDRPNTNLGVLENRGPEG